MKKLMMFAAAAVVAGSVSAITFSVDESNSCGTQNNSSCPFVGFDFKQSGKLAQELTKKGYKTVQSFSSKGAIGLVYEGGAGGGEEDTNTTQGVDGETTDQGGDQGDDTTGGDTTGGDTTGGQTDTGTDTGDGSNTNGTEEAEDECCPAPATVTMVVQQKVDGEKVTVAFRELGITRLSFFGKNWEKVADVIDGVGKSGKYYGVESDLGWATGDRDGVAGVAPVYPEEAEDLEVYFIYSGFGKAKIGLTKLGKAGGNCGTKESGCDPDLIFKSYKGYFAGFAKEIEDSIDVLDYTCESGCNVVIFGGTWTAKFNKKLTTEAKMLSKYGVKLEDE
ncbi:MAG: hypothetical protein IKR48_11605 [Kiritimatiellae bacterium]|nr:hypothetical protein [Kiritimatiellia bacterium]